MSNSNEFLGTGRRKTSVARVRISAGSGKIQVNGRTFEVYFPLESQRMAVQQPFVTTATSGKYDVFINVAGGGPVGQAGAVLLHRLGDLRRDLFGAAVDVLVEAFVHGVDQTQATGTVGIHRQRGGVAIVLDGLQRDFAQRLGLHDVLS